MRKRYNDMELPAFRYLSDSTIKNPLLVVQDFFNIAELELFRQELRTWFKLACGNYTYNQDICADLSGLVSIHQQITRLLEAAYVLLTKDEPGLEIDKAHPLYQDLQVGKTQGVPVDERLKDDVMKHCRLLQDTEINNVKRAFKAVFDFMPLSAWQDELDMLLYYSLNDTPIADDCDNSQLYFPMHELLEKLLECMYVINELTIKADYV